jgi:hypothetical protein
MEHYYVYVPGNFFRPDMVDYPRLLSRPTVYPDDNCEEYQHQDEQSNQEQENIEPPNQSKVPTPEVAKATPKVAQATSEVTKSEVKIDSQATNPPQASEKTSESEPKSEPEATTNTLDSQTTVSTQTTVSPPEVIKTPEVIKSPEVKTPEVIKTTATPLLTTSKPVNSEASVKAEASVNSEASVQPHVSSKPLQNKPVATKPATMADRIRQQQGLPPTGPTQSNKQKNIPLDMNYDQNDDHGEAEVMANYDKDEEQEYEDIDTFGEGLESWAESAVELAKAQKRQARVNDGLCQSCHQVPPTYANQQFCKPCFNSMPFCTQNCGHRTNQKNGLCSHCYNDMKVLCSCCATRYTVYDSGICPQCYWEQKKARQQESGENYHPNSNNKSYPDNKSFPEKQCASEWSWRGKMTKCQNKTTYKYCKSCHDDMRQSVVM